MKATKKGAMSAKLTMYSALLKIILPHNKLDLGLGRRPENTRRIVWTLTRHFEGVVCGVCGLLMSVCQQWTALSKKKNYKAHVIPPARTTYLPSRQINTGATRFQMHALFLKARSPAVGHVTSQPNIRPRQHWTVTIIQLGLFLLSSCCRSFQNAAGREMVGDCVERTLSTSKTKRAHSH